MTKEQVKTQITLISVLLATVIILFFSNNLINKAFAEIYETPNNLNNFYQIKRDIQYFGYNSGTKDKTTNVTVNWTYFDFYDQQEYSVSNITIAERYDTPTRTVYINTAYSQGTHNLIRIDINANTQKINIINYTTYIKLNSEVGMTNYYLSKIFEKITNIYDLEIYTQTQNENEIFPNIEVTGGYIGVNYIGQEVNLENLIELTINYNRQDGTITYTLPANNSYTFYYIVISFMGGEEHLNINPYWWGLNFSTSNAVNNTIYAERTGGEIIEYTYQNDGYIPRTEQTNNDIYIRDIIYYTPTTNTARTTILQFGSIQYINGYNTAIKYIEEIRQTAYNQGYSAGVETAQTGDFYHLISAVFSVPISVITGFADVTILGVNMLTVLRSILTLCIVAMIIKLVL